MTSPLWLPPLVCFPGDWNRFDEYVEQVYEIFVRDFVTRAVPTLRGTRVSLRRIPEFQGKSATFWHLITEGKVEEDRSPVVDRCERIAWVRAILERVEQNIADLRVWKNERNGGSRLLIALPGFEYLVVLDLREDRQDGRKYFLLLTAYPVDQPHRRRKLEAEYLASKTQKG